MSRPNIVVLVLICLGGTVAAAQESLAQAAVAVESSSKREFPTVIEAGASGHKHVLVGMGVRTRTFLNVKVYAAGYYVDSTPAVAALAPWAETEPKRLENDETMFDRLLRMDFGMTLRLVMVRDVDGEAMASAFDDALAPRVALAETEKGMPGGAEALARFRGYFGLDKVTDGSELVFSCVDGALHSKIKGETAPVIDSPALCWALFDVYLGNKPISKGIKKNVGRGVHHLLAGAGAD